MDASPCRPRWAAGAAESGCRCRERASRNRLRLVIRSASGLPPAPARGLASPDPFLFLYARFRCRVHAHKLAFVIRGTRLLRVIALGLNPRARGPLSPWARSAGRPPHHPLHSRSSSVREEPGSSPASDRQRSGSFASGDAMPGTAETKLLGFRHVPAPLTYRLDLLRDTTMMRQSGINLAPRRDARANAHRKANWT